MSADRLIAALLLLQRRGSLTAGQLARELEISPRTARRDLEALGRAGIPVYSQPGRGGGWRLVGGARTDLSGLTDEEVRGLFLAVALGPTSSRSGDSALAKLSTAVPARFRAQVDEVAATVLRDDRSWRGVERADEPKALPTVQEALARRRVLTFGYRRADGRTSAREASVLGIVVKAGRWYAVCTRSGARRTFRIDRMSEAALGREPAEVEEGFDLGQAWRDIIANVPWVKEPVLVSAHVEPFVAQSIPALGVVELVASDGRPDGRVDVVVAGPTVRSTVGLLLGFGEAVQITGGEEAVQWAREVTRQLAAAYL